MKKKASSRFGEEAFRDRITGRLDGRGGLGGDKAIIPRPKVGSGIAKKK
jgi:hypothetical protein